MKRVLKWSGLVLLGAAAAAGALLAHTWYAKPLSIEWFYARSFLQFALDEPELLTQLRILESMGIRSHNARLTDASTAHDDRMFARLKDDLATLRRYDASAYTGQDRLSYDIFGYFVDMQARGEPWRYHNYPVNQLFGVQSELPNLMTQAQQVNDATDAEHYIARLGEFPRKMDQVIEGIKLRESKGIVPPQFVVEKVLDQIKGFLAPGAGGNTLTVSFKEKLDKIPADKMDAATRAKLIARVEQAVGASVVPAYERAGGVPRNAAAESDAQRWRLGAAGRRSVLPVRDRVQHHDHDGRGRDPCAGPRGGGADRRRDGSDPPRRRLRRRHAGRTHGQAREVARAALSGYR